MPEPTLVEQPRISAEAWINKQRPGGATTPELERAARIRAEVAKDVSWQQISEGMIPHPPPTEGLIRKINNENIGIKRKGGDGPDAGDKDYSNDPRAQERRERVDVQARLARELIDSTYDGLADEPGGLTKKEKQDALVGEFLKAAYSWPQSRMLLEDFGRPNDPIANAARREFIEGEFLRNPQVMKKLMDVFGGIYNIKEDALMEVVAEAQERLARAEKIKKAKDDELERVQKSRGAAETARGAYEQNQNRINVAALRGESATWAPLLASKQRELEELTRVANRLYPTLEVANNEEEQSIDPNSGKVLTRRSVVRQENAGVKAQIDQAEARMTTLRGEMDEIQLKMATLAGADGDMSSLDRQIEDLRRQEATLIESTADAELAYVESKRKYEIARAARAAEEEEFVNRVEGMYAEAGRRYMNDEIPRYEAAQAKIAQDAISKANGEDEAGIQKGMARAWREAENRGKQRVKKEQVAQDMQVALRERSTEWLTKSFMETNRRELVRKFGVNSAEVREEDARLSERYKDKAFMDRMNAIVAERLFKNYFESGGKLKAEQVSVLSETTWGEAAIDAAFEQNAKAGKLMDKIKDKAGFQGTRMEFFRALAKNPNAYKNAGIGAAGILALIFGAPFLIAGATAVASGYSVATGAIA